MNGETWRPVKGYEGFYEVSDCGRVRSVEHIDNIKHLHPSKVLKPRADNRGYMRVHLSKEGDAKYYSVHRLVAQAFVDKPDGCDIVNHLDSNPSNNCADNLEWTTYKGNMQWASKQGHMKGCPQNLVKAQETKKVPVIAILPDGNRMSFNSQIEAATALGVQPGHIAPACRKEYGYKKLKGIEFEYADRARREAAKPNRIGASKEERSAATRQRMMGNTYGVGKHPSDRTKQLIRQAIGKAVVQYSMEGDKINRFSSCREAELETGAKHISDCAAGRRRTAGGFLWRYVA